MHMIEKMGLFQYLNKTYRSITHKFNFERALDKLYEIDNYEENL